MTRESHLVELVDTDGRATGSCTVAEAHTAPGRLHRAFSVLLLSDDRRVLLQRRAAAKTRFAGRWANTCCGHPGPTSSVVAAAGLRLVEEMGLSGIPLREVGRFTYQASDATTGRVEHEYDHVLVGEVELATVPEPDPTEVASWAWLRVEELRPDLRDHPERYAPWLSGVLALACPD